MPNIRSTYTDSVHFFGQEDPRELAARFGTPLYVYNENILRQRCRDLMGLSSHPGYRVNYSVKANNNPALLRIVREEGCQVDAMSPGELHFDLLAGFKPQEITYICNNVSVEEMQNALDHDLLLSVDSLSQLERLGAINRGGRVMVRFNPGIGAGHHKKVITAGKDTKFGVNIESLLEVFSILDKYSMRLEGINQHIGSLFMDGGSYLEAGQVLLDLAADLLGREEGRHLRIIDFGGGFGIPYAKYEDAPRLDLKEFGTLLHHKLVSWAGEHHYRGQFFIEPGRYIPAESGLLLGRVQAVKNNAEIVYVGTDIGFNVLMRPVLYSAFHDLEIYRENGMPDTRMMEQTVVGNICESGDILADGRMLPQMQEDDMIAILDAGAYGFAMASEYNNRLRPAEVLIGTDGKAKLIRRRETLEDLAATLVQCAGIF